MKKLSLILTVLFGVIFLSFKNEALVIGTEVGNVAPIIKGTTPNGDTLSLKTLRGNYVLIDFWASWCRPCRFENRNLIRTVKHFKDVEFPIGKNWTGKVKTTKGFQVFSVSLDKSSAAWKKAIKADKLDWPWHISDLKAWQSKLGAKYNIMSIPTNFLLGPDGKIIAKNLRGSALDQKLDELKYQPKQKKKK